MANQIPYPNAPEQWMQKPAPIPGCPVGLEYLLQIDKLEVQQNKSLTEILTGWERNNKYFIRNGNGQQCYFAEERTGACMRQCCGKDRGFDIYITDNMQQEVLKISREFICCAGCCWCAGCCKTCGFLVTISSPSTGEIFGHVKQGQSCWKPKLFVLDANMERVLQIDGPTCIINGPCCPCENEFKLMTLDQTTQIGNVTRVYSGFITEMVSDADRFRIEFPMDLSVQVKATLMGALFLIDLMFFEKNE